MSVLFDFAASSEKVALFVTLSSTSKPDDVSGDSPIVQIYDWSQFQFYELEPRVSASYLLWLE